MWLAKVMLLVGICSLAASTPVEQTPRDMENYGKTTSADPKMQMSSEELRPKSPGLKVTLKGQRDTVSGNYYAVVEVTKIPIYTPEAVPPPVGETTIPDNDDIENIQVYFANEEGRILEVRFNRFQQSLARLWRRPYHLLRDDVPATMTGVNVGQNDYSMSVMVPAEALPANMTRVQSVVVNPTLEGGDKYYAHYRIYNYPIAFDWNTKIYQLYKKVDKYRFVPEEINSEYSSWWNGI